MLPIILVIPLTSLLLRGRRAAMADAVLILGLVLALGAIFVCIFDPRAMWFEMLLEPSLHPWVSPLNTLKQLSLEIFLQRIAGLKVLGGQPSLRVCRGCYFFPKSAETFDQA